jgi:hypothetical protein
MFRNLLLAATCIALSTAAGPTRMPVLVELFTSEGCSSCPPADLLLQELDPRTIVLSEHVDYWDHQGWRDPFSSHAFTERQETYARRFRLEGAYTPQMVVDGAAQFVGNDGRRAADEIAKASRSPRVDPRLQRTAAGIHVEIDDAPGPADVMLALADDAAVSQVAAGENKGRKLHHVAVVRSLRKIGAVKRGASFRGDVALPAGAAAQRIVVFLQESGQSRVSGAALLLAAHQ